MAGQNSFCFPVKELSNERVKLTPFIASTHGPEFHALSSPHPSLYAHIRWGPFDTLAEFTTNFLEKVVDANDSWMLYAIIDKTKPTSSPTNDPDGALAGMIGYSDASVEHLSTHIGIGITLPAFQRTYVTANAYGLLLQYALDPPKRGGLGLRRVQCNISSANCGSRRFTEKMGCRLEGVIRWHYVVRDGVRKGKVGMGTSGMSKGGEGGDLGRDTAVYGLCWDDWEKRGRETARGAMESKL